MIRTLSSISKGALVVGVQTDLLFPLQQQIELTRCLPNAKFVALESGDGHDGFLLEFERLNDSIREHLMERCAWLFDGGASGSIDDTPVATVNSVFGEAEQGDF
jgi:homoserine O-acetyltransferase